MCSIVILRQSDSEWPLIIGANRDEMVSRKCLPPGKHWDDRPHVFAGKDLEAGGTWLGINDYGVVCGIMNRINTLGTDPNKRSRGELVLDALDHADANESLNAIVEIEKNSYRGFNMLIADNTNAYWIKSSEDSEVIEYFNIPDGLSMITAYDRNDIDSKRIWIQEEKLLKKGYDFQKSLSDFLDMSNFLNHFKSNIDCSSNPFLNDDDGPILLEEGVTIMAVSYTHLTLPTNREV